ncbi:MAG: creatininase family protein [Gemmatimonadetes bacterium]|nr:creatininase family protein [Gemmatimonadota bacterium]
MENHHWGHATWTELAGLGLGSGGAGGSARTPSGLRVVAVLPVGAVEAHGPHLPLTTDVTIATAAAEAALDGLRRLGLRPMLLPPLPYTAAPFAAGFPGTISVRPATFAALLEDVAASLERQGVAALVVVNAHLDPAHLTAIRDVARARETPAAAAPSRHQGETPSRRRDDAPARHAASAQHRQPMPVIHPDLTARRWASRLTDEFKSGACHAGRYETSVVMAAAPELIREDERRGLVENPASLSVAIRQGAATFEDAGVGEAYCGDPAAATRKEGERTIAVLGGIVVDAVEEVLS